LGFFQGLHPPLLLHPLVYFRIPYFTFASPILLLLDLAAWPLSRFCFTFTSFSCRAKPPLSLRGLATFTTYGQLLLVLAGFVILTLLPGQK
jgi:hypothetical protein